MKKQKKQTKQNTANNRKCNEFIRDSRGRVPTVDGIYAPGALFTDQDMDDAMDESEVGWAAHKD